jgi:hypothetical protein
MKEAKFKLFFMLVALLFCVNAFAWDVCTSSEERKVKREEEIQAMQENFKWWPTDAQPGPVKDAQRSGYWWWPNEPGTAKPWGNRGVYLHPQDYLRLQGRGAAAGKTGGPGRRRRPSTIYRRCSRSASSARSTTTSYAGTCSRSSTCSSGSALIWRWRGA